MYTPCANAVPDLANWCRLHARLDLPLAHRVNAGDVIHTFDAVKITLMDGVEPELNLVV